ncbi:unnamed protein product [Schistosoma curassoni]|uniref:Uncharacterized protein n=1 Tax=Schistosoma curassoni TaxID=6186 RepID=A0A183JU98_9TREM|nr:unnamed protein product [Schistosoma curassoni]
MKVIVHMVYQMTIDIRFLTPQLLMLFVNP